MNSGYDCPDCGYDPPELDGFYYVDKGKIYDCTKWVERTPEERKGSLDLKGGMLVQAGVGHMEPDPPKGFKAYPVYGPQVFSYAAAMEFGGNPVDWEETHWCPKCKKEFSFGNGNY